MKEYRFTIEENFAVRIWEDEDGVLSEKPFIFQPFWPNGQKWENEDQARDWAELFIDSMKNPYSEYLPGYSKEEPRIARPEELLPKTSEEITTPVEIEENQE